MRSIDTLRGAFDPTGTTSCTPRTASAPTRRCRACAPSTTSTPSPPRAGRLPRAGRRRAGGARSACRPRSPSEVAAGWGLADRDPQRRRRRPLRAAGAPTADAGCVAAPSSGRYVLALGGIEPRKGSIDLLEAIDARPRQRPGRPAGVRRRRDPVRLPRLPRPSSTAGRRRLESPTTCSASSTTPSCRRWSRPRGARVRLTKEGFGLAAMEALAAGVPVVARDLPVLREVLGDTALFAESTAGRNRCAILGGTYPAAPLTRNWALALARQLPVGFGGGQARGLLPCESCESDPAKAGRQVRLMTRMTIGRPSAGSRNGNPTGWQCAMTAGQLTRAELESRSNQLGRIYGSSASSRTAWLPCPCLTALEFVLACLAIWKLGATPCPCPQPCGPAERAALLRWRNHPWPSVAGSPRGPSIPTIGAAR